MDWMDSGSSAPNTLEVYPSIVWYKNYGEGKTATTGQHGPCITIQITIKFKSSNTEITHKSLSSQPTMLCCWYIPYLFRTLFPPPLLASYLHHSSSNLLPLGPSITRYQTLRSTDAHYSPPTAA